MAEPSIKAFALDADLYMISGAPVYKDGRLPANTGAWVLTAWSRSQQKTLEVTVKYDGTVATGARPQNSAPSPNDQPVPRGWLDSTYIFAAVAAYLGCDDTYAQLVVFNAASYKQAPGIAVWGLNFPSAIPNQLVKWDGAYLGPQSGNNIPVATNLTSAFLKTSGCACQIIGGTPYSMDDPAWLIGNSDQNKDTCAYKFFAALHVLGYQTEPASPKPHVGVLRNFQKREGLPVSDIVTGTAVTKLDSLLALREPKLAAKAMTFPLYDHMQPLHPHDVSKDWLAHIYQLPMAVLPQYLQMGAHETAQCIWSQCVGFLQDATGADLPCQQLGCFTTDLNVDYRFVGAYFDPRTRNERLPSAAVHVGTVLHEYAHYLDGQLRGKFQDLPHQGLIATFDFYNISYDMSQYQSTCAPRRTNDPKDWITLYGFSGGGGQCPLGKAYIFEEFAEAFSMYVASGKRFRAAATQNAKIAQKYDWLKTNVFKGLEYDTDLPSGVVSGCNDLAGYQNQQPGYASCAEDYLWDGELRTK